jgi:hypothetical protein
VRRPWRFLAAALIWILLTAVPGAAFEYSPPWPEGTVGVETPSIGMRLVLGEGERLVRGFRFFVQRTAWASLPDPDAEGARAIAHLNMIRRAAGLQPVRWEPSLGAAAAAHARFLVLHADFRAADPHREAQDRVGFTGETAGARARFFNWNGSVSEVIHFEMTAEEAIDGWMESLYHRIPLIAPSTSRGGYAVDGVPPDYVQVMKLGGLVAGEGQVIWPPHASTGIPTGWSGLENPDPLRLYGGWKGPIGYTVTLTFGTAPEQIEVSTMRLTGPDGRVVPAYAFTPANDPLLTDTIALIPEQPLQPNTRYEAVFEGRADNRPFSRRWFFTTGAGMRPMLRSREARLDGITLGEIRVIGHQFRQGMQVFLDGQPVRSLAVESAETIRFLAPEGFPARTRAELLLVTPDGFEMNWPDFFDGTEGFVTEGMGYEFEEIPFFVDGVEHRLPVLGHAAGLLIPQTALEAMGARAERVEPSGRTFWLLGGRVGDMVPGRAAYRIDGQLAVAPLPARQVGDRLYLPEPFVRALAGNRILALRDVAGHWAEEQIFALVERGIVSGFEDWTFRPAAELTRAAFLKMLVTARGLVPLQNATGGFADVGGHWIATQGWVGAAARAGIVRPTDYEGGRLLPDTPITRGEIARMIVRTLGLESTALVRNDLSEWVADRRFSDFEQWREEAPYVTVAVESGIVRGYPEEEGTFAFRPRQRATRAEAVVMVTRMLESGLLPQR